VFSRLGKSTWNTRPGKIPSAGEIANLADRDFRYLGSKIDAYHVTPSRVIRALGGETSVTVIRSCVSLTQNDWLRPSIESMTIGLSTSTKPSTRISRFALPRSKESDSFSKVEAISNGFNRPGLGAISVETGCADLLLAERLSSIESNFNDA
jgi:hypothetical protein